MDAVTVTCDACGRIAFVHNVHYTYNEPKRPGLPAADHELLAIERLVECPVCGRRTQVEVNSDRQVEANSDGEKR